MENQHLRSAVLILGAGGHAQVVADILLRAYTAGQPVVPIGYLDDDRSLHAKVFLGLPVLGGIDALAHIAHDAVIIAVGANPIRKRLADQLTAGRETFAIAHHPAATLAPDVYIGPGTVICAGVVVNTGAVIGSHVILNTGCSVDHHSQVADFVHIAPGVHTGGEVVIEEGALIGIGATIVPRVAIGAWATVGAGAVVTRSAPASVTVVGVPARVLKKR